MPLRALPLALSLPLLAGCPGSPDGDVPSVPEAEYCSAPDGQPNGERALEIGALGPHGFEAWSDGSEVTLETGGQGGTMVVVSLRVPAQASDGDEACWVVTLDNEVSGSGAGDIGDLKSAYVFQRQGEHMEVDGLFDLLGYGEAGLSDQVLTLSAAVNAEAFGAEHTVSVTLR